MGSTLWNSIGFVALAYLPVDALLTLTTESIGAVSLRHFLLKISSWKKKLRINKRFMGSWDSRKESIKYQFPILSGERPDLSFPWFYRLFPQALRNLERLFYSWSNWLRILPLVKKWFLRELLIFNWSNFAQSIYLLWGIFVSKKFGENCNSIFFGHI